MKVGRISKFGKICGYFKKEYWLMLYTHKKKWCRYCIAAKWGYSASSNYSGTSKNELVAKRFGIYIEWIYMPHKKACMCVLTPAVLKSKSEAEKCAYATLDRLKGTRYT